MFLKLPLSTIAVVLGLHASACSSDASKPSDGRTGSGGTTGTGGGESTGGGGGGTQSGGGPATGGTNGGGGSLASGGSGGTQDGSGGSSGPIDGIDGEEYAAPCPNSFPGTGPCTDEGTVCSYGNAGRYSCRMEVTCSANAWSVSSSCDPSYPTDDCPADAFTGGACSTANARCAGPNGIECVCSADAWACDLPVVNNPNCPPFVPNTGTVCDSSAAGCQYMRCNASGTIEAALCEDGVWSAGTSSTCMTSDD